MYKRLLPMNSMRGLFPLGLLVLFLASQILVHFIWARGGYEGAIEYHAGEAYEAFHAAVNLDRFGFRWGGLQDMATSPAPAAHPYLYIHHPNFGLYLSFLLQKIGLTGFEAQMAFSTLLWSAGVVLFSLLIRSLTGSETIALAAGALVGLDPGNALEYGCNIHRAADFGSAAVVLFSTLKFLKKPGFVWGLILAGSFGLAMGADYIMFLFLTLFALLLGIGWAMGKWSEISLATAAGLPAKAVKKPIRWLSRLVIVTSPVIGIGLIAGGAFALRQGQVLAGAGQKIWVSDFVFQILNRTHNEQLYPGQWSQDTTDFYAKQSVLNPGFAPKNAIPVRFSVIGRSLSRNLCFYFFGNRPSWSGTLGAKGFSVFFFLIILVIGTIARRAKPNDLNTPILRHAGRFTLLGGISALLIMIFLLPTYFTQWFPVFRLPLFLAALFATLALKNLSEYIGAKITYSIIFTLVAFKLSALPATLTVVDRLHLDHAEFARGVEAKVTYCNFTSASISTFTRNITCVPTTAGFLKLAATGCMESPKDFLFCLERDRQSNSVYLFPEIIVFFKWGDPASHDAIEKSPYFRKKAEGRTFTAFERI
jgi:hypothetical protein